jgi:hypothetical protein
MGKITPYKSIKEERGDSLLDSSKQKACGHGMVYIQEGENEGGMRTGKRR